MERLFGRLKRPAVLTAPDVAEIDRHLLSIALIPADCRDERVVNHWLDERLKATEPGGEGGAEK